MRQSFRRACVALARGRDQATRGALLDLTPYDFRHSFGSDVYAATKDLKATQEAMGHADMRTTARYMRAAVKPAVAQAMLKLRAARQPAEPPAPSSGTVH